MRLVERAADKKHTTRVWHQLGKVPAIPCSLPPLFHVSPPQARHPQSYSQRQSSQPNTTPSPEPEYSMHCLIQSAPLASHLPIANPSPYSPAQYYSPGQGLPLSGLWTSPNQPPCLQLPAPGLPLCCRNNLEKKSQSRARHSRAGNPLLSPIALG